MWGANIDWQLVLDPGLVIDYMTKYVTKSELATTKTAARLIHSILTRTVTDDGMYVQSFLRRIMNKLLGDRMLSKQETCHLMLSIPIVHSNHSLINIDLINSTRQIVPPTNNADRPIDNAEDVEDRNVLRMSRIDAYAMRMDMNSWLPLHLVDLDFNQMQTMSLRDFCLSFKVGQRGPSTNKIMLDTAKFVVNFYPSPSSSPTKDTYTYYCKYALMKYSPWQDNSVNSWGGKNATDDEVHNKWIQFLQSLGDDIPDLLQRELEQNATNRNDDENNDDRQREDSSFRSEETIIPSQEDYLADDPNLAELIQDRLLDDIDSADIEWDQDHDWSTPSFNYDLPSLRALFSQFKDSDIVRIQREVQYHSLNNH